MTSPYPFTTGGLIPTDMHGIPLGAPAAPLAAEIINGMTSTDGATLLSIPANTTVLVDISLMGSQATATSHGKPAVVTVGATVTPAAGATLASLDMQTTSGISAVAQSAVFDGIWIYSGTSAASLRLNLNSATACTAIVNGAIVT